MRLLFLYYHSIFFSKLNILIIHIHFKCLKLSLFFLTHLFGHTSKSSNNSKDKVKVVGFNCFIMLNSFYIVYYIVYYIYCQTVLYINHLLSHSTIYYKITSCYKTFVFNKNFTVSTISSGVPTRPLGCCSLSNFVGRYSSFVFIHPGLIEFTFTSGLKVIAKAWVKDWFLLWAL